MDKWLFIILVACGIGFYNHRKNEKLRTQQETLMQMMALDKGVYTDYPGLGIPQNCVGKKYCITVFISPSDPVSVSSEPTFLLMNRYLINHHSDIGFGLIIGADTPDALLKKQEQLIPIESYRDDSGQIMKRRNITSYPTWVTTNFDGKEVFRQTNGFQITDEGRISQTLSMMLGK